MGYNPAFSSKNPHPGRTVIGLSGGACFVFFVSARRQADSAGVDKA